MTLIIGMKCADGLVMGSDGAATLGAMGHSTVLQPVKKLRIIADSVIVGTSGYVGIGQRIAGEVESLYTSGKLKNQKPHEVMTVIRTEIWNKVLMMELQAANVAKNVAGGAAMASAISHSVVGITLNKVPCLFQFDQQGAPEQASGNLPFISIGSGMPLADPFLAFLRRIFWEKRLPSVSEGVFATLWTLRQAIQTTPGGVAEPIQIIEMKDGKARELAEDEFREHDEAIEAAEKSLRDYREHMKSPATEEVPPPPRPPDPKAS